VNAVLLTGGWAHPAEATFEPLADLLRAAGFDTTMTEAVDALPPLLADRADLLVVNACRFRMLDERYSDEQRDEWASEASPMVRRAVSDHLRAGKPLLGLHAAAICFDDWPEWSALLGGGWQWGASDHGPVAPFDVAPASGHPVSEGIEPFTVEDECYECLAVADDVAPFLAADAAGRTHTLGWTREEGSARVAYCALGHDQRSLEEPAHQRLLGRIITWLTGAAPA
jgi:hypothetical protein